VLALGPLLFTVLAAGGGAASASTGSLPPATAGPSALEREVASYVEAERRRGFLAPDERDAWAVYDLTSDRMLVSINLEEPLQAASLVKPALALAFFDQAAHGQFLYGPRSRRQLERMIRYSDNAAANWVLRVLHGPRSASRILDSEYGTIFRHTQIVEYIPSGGRTYRNRASVGDYTRFLRELWRGALPGAPEILRIMGLPNPHRLYREDEDLPARFTAYDKTGSTSRLCGEMGILQVTDPDGTRYAYTFAGVVEKRFSARRYGAWIRSRGDLIREVAMIVHRGLAERHATAAPVAELGEP
jgi:beta-lactamase class A